MTRALSDWRDVMGYSVFLSAIYFNKTYFGQCTFFVGNIFQQNMFWLMSFFWRQYILQIKSSCSKRWLSTKLQYGKWKEMGQIFATWQVTNKHVEGEIDWSRMSFFYDTNHFLPYENWVEFCLNTIDWKIQILAFQLSPFPIQD